MYMDSDVAKHVHMAWLRISKDVDAHQNSRVDRYEYCINNCLFMPSVINSHHIVDI